MSGETPPRLRAPSLLAMVVWMAALSGAVNLATQSWSPYFRLNLMLHPALAVVALALVLRQALVRLRGGAAATPWSFRIGLVVLFAILPVRSWVLAKVPSIPPDAVDGRMVLPAVVVGVALALAGLIRPVRSPGGPRNVLAAIGVTLPWLMATAMGAVILLRSGGGHDRRLFNVHALWGGLAALTGWLAAAALDDRGRRLRGWAGAAVAGGGVLVATALAANVALGVWGSPELVEVRTDPRPGSPAARVPTFGTPLDARWLGIADGCGAPDGCHAEIVAEVRHSLHGAAFAARLASGGEEASAFGPGCLGCHVPGALAGFREGAAPPRLTAPQGDAVGCLLCHGVEQASVDPPWGASYRLRLDADLLGPFLSGGLGGGWRGIGERYAISLNARAHGRAFAAPILTDEQLCHTCHHLQIRTITVGIPCADCHMPRAVKLGEKGEHKSHRFLGANVAMAHVLGDDGRAELLASRALGACLVDTPPERDEERDATRPPIPPEAFERPCLPVELRLVAGGAGGAPLRLEVRTSNPWMTHGFPSGSLGTVEAWLEVRVRDGGSGGELLAVGGKAADGAVSADAPWLGDPTPVAPRAPGSWHEAPSSAARQLLPGDDRVDTFELPASAVAATALDVSAEWKYRKVSAAAWAARGGGAGAGEALPTLTVARHMERLAPPAR